MVTLGPPTPVPSHGPRASRTQSQMRPPSSPNSNLLMSAARRASRRPEPAEEKCKGSSAARMRTQSSPKGQCRWSAGRKRGCGAHMEAWAELTWFLVAASSTPQPSRASSTGPHLHERRVSKQQAARYGGSLCLYRHVSAGNAHLTPGVESDARPRTPRASPLSVRVWADGGAMQKSM